ncbi:MAG: hypothetical protein JSS02_28670 [Planctomycetes bacterium]|nr:hypothetical protein [Planctomycetota bacterium]
MDPDTLYERWRQSRSQFEPATNFADEIVQSISSVESVEPQVAGRTRLPSALRAAVCAAAVVAVVAHVVELLTLFSATPLAN